MGSELLCLGLGLAGREGDLSVEEGERAIWLPRSPQCGSNATNLRTTIASFCQTTFF